MGLFNLVSEYEPMGDQPQAIAQLVEGVNRGDAYQTLLGATGTGKTYTIANVKQNSRGFPTKELKEKCVNRGDVASFGVEVDGVKMWASCHKDKQPMSLIHTTDTVLEGPPRFRTFAKFKNGKVKRKTFTLQQPSVHATYRSNFWAVDRFNKLSLGPHSMQYAVYT